MESNRGGGSEGGGGSPPVRPAPAGLTRLVIGPHGPRAGWRLLAYLGLFLALFAINDWLRARFLSHMDQILRFGIVEVLSAIDLIVASAVMARFEKRHVGDYGLPWPRRRVGEYAGGLVVGVLWVSLSIAGLAAAGAYHVEHFGGRAGEMALYGGLFGLLMFTIGVKEELYYRGYPLFTLATGMGFWPAAVVTSLIFGIQHIVFAHVTWLGGVNIALGGFVLCLMVRATGSLWMAIGAHTAINWTEAFLYGVPVSGTTLPGTVIHSSLSGPVWLSGGPAGPEGSVIFTAAMLPVAWGLATWMRRRVRGDSDDD